MKYLVVGAGALGSIVAAHLARAGEDVTLVARGRRAAQLAEQGVRVAGLADISIRVPVVAPDASVDADVMIQCVKTYDSVSSLSRLTFAKAPAALSLQNGVLKNEELAAKVGAANVLGATANVSGELQADGLVRFTMNQELPVGEPGGGRSARVEAIVSALAGSGIAATVSENITSVEWTKYASFVPLMAPAILSRHDTWKILTDPDASRVVAMLANEMAALAAACGVALADPKGFSPRAIASASLDDGAAMVRAFGEGFAKRAPTHRVSTLQDLLRGGRLETEAILGHAVTLARRQGVAVPTIETCASLGALLNRQAEAAIAAAMK